MKFALELVVAPDGLEVPVRVPLPTSFGRAPGMNDVVVSMTSVSRKQCRFGVEKGRAFVEDLGSTQGVFVNGVRRDARVSLEPGDFIELPWGLVYRFVDGTTPPALAVRAQDELMKLVVQTPHDEGVWRVWADRLLEAGDPLGERIAAGARRDPAADAKALGPLAREYVSGGLEVDWRHGFMRRAVLRNASSWWPSTWAPEWKLLLEHPLAAFVEELEVDALSYSRGIDDREPAVTKIVASLEVLARHPALPQLHTVRFGPSPRSLWNRQLDGAWRRACEVHGGLRVGPIWVASAAWLQLLSTPPGVSVLGLEVGAQRKLFEDQANLVGPLPDCAFSLDAPDGSPASAVALRLDLENGLWVAEDVGAEVRRTDLPLWVNGRRHARYRVRPGDVLEPAPGLSFKFVME